MALEKSAKIVFETCLKLESEQSVLIIYDENTEKIGLALEDAAKLISDDVSAVKIPVGKVSGEEPPADTAEKMLSVDIIVCPTTKSLTHTEATKAATKNGAKVATMPGITEEIFDLVDVDYDSLQKTTKRLSEILEKGSQVRVTTEIGTDITLSIDGRTPVSDDCSFSDGMPGNLPTGESFIAPVEGTAQGTYYIDAAINIVGKVEEPIKVTVKDGFAVKIEGGKEAEKVLQTLKSINDNNAFNIAELGIGTNEKAKISGNPLQDEKILGTCHIAFGKNSSFGGNITVPFHSDGIIKDPTIYVDDQKIMEDGKLII